MDWNELQSLTWPGYARKNGGKGIRNRVLVIYTVKCAEFVAQQIVAKSGSTNVELLGFDGCTDNQYAVNLLISFIRHPNVGAVLAVGLGCEYVQPEWLSKIAEEEGKPTSWMFIQNEGGTQPAVRKGVEWVQSARKELENTPRVEMSVKDLVIGIVLAQNFFKLVIRLTDIIIVFANQNVYVVPVKISFGILRCKAHTKSDSFTV